MFPPSDRSSVVRKGFLDLLQQALDGCVPLRDSAQPGAEFLRDRAECGRLRGSRICHDDRAARVTAVPNRRIDGDPPEERYAQLLRRSFTASKGEDLRPFPAMAADEVAHVFDDAEERDIDLLKHRHTLPERRRARLLVGWSL